MKNKKRILIVDDELDSIEFVKAVLTDVGEFDIIPAKDGNEGINKAVTDKPDLIILDVIMPGTDGFLVFHELRNLKETQDIPIIMLTGVADKIGIRFMKGDMKNYIGSEPIEYIEKPLDPAILKNAVRQVFNL
ncbi:MAG: response regulator [Ignavibacteriaceae bacterium]|nr:response regulator [Ignavibacteriaceae bacterium]